MVLPDDVEGRDEGSFGGGTMIAIPVLSKSIASSLPLPESSSIFPALRLDLRPFPPSIPFAIGRTLTSPPFASTIALVRLVDGNSAFVVGDGGRREMAAPQSGQVDFWRFRGAGLQDGLRAPSPIIDGLVDGCWMICAVICSAD